MIAVLKLDVNLEATLKLNSKDNFSGNLKLKFIMCSLGKSQVPLDFFWFCLLLAEFYAVKVNHYGSRMP